MKFEMIVVAIFAVACMQQYSKDKTCSGFGRPFQMKVLERMDMTNLLLQRFYWSLIRAISLAYCARAVSSAVSFLMQLALVIK